MNKRVYLMGFIFILAAVATTWGLAERSPTPATADRKVSAAHDHGKASAPHPEEDMDALFEEDEHEGHGHAESGHGDADDHSGHRQGERPSAHAGHDHGHEGEPGGFCPEHRVPEEEDALCHGDHIGDLHPGEGMMVRLASMDVAGKAGLSSSTPQAISLAGGNSFPGRVEFNRNRLAHITPLAPGVIRRVRVRPGEKVDAGAILAEVAMPEVASLKAQLIGARAREAQAEAAYQRERDLLERGISSRREFQQAESDRQATRSASEQYRQQLLNFGLSPADIRELVRTGVSSALVHLRAPFAGTVVEVRTAAGEGASTGSPILTLADLDPLWIELSLPESRIYLARMDAPVQARFEGLPGAVFSGRIFQVGAAVDERTRTLKALAAVENPGHRLKVGMFGKVRLLEGDEAQGLAIPTDALQSIDGLPFVFVKKEPDLFELRRVLTGDQADGIVPILAGLSPGEEVVSGQGFALKSEVLKARLGASCADH